LIVDPWFYAVAVPAVLITGISKSGFASGLGSLATPMIALTVSVPQAAAIMLPLLMVMDAAGLQQLWRSRDPALVRLLVPAGLAGIVLGALLFGALTPKAVAGVLGAITLLFLAQQLLVPIRRDGRPALGRPGLRGRLGFHELRRPRRRAADQRLRPAAEAGADEGGGDDGGVLRRHQCVEVDPVCVPRPDRPADDDHVARAAAVRAPGGLDRRLADEAHPPGLVLPPRLDRHGPDRRQAAVGRVALIRRADARLQYARRRIDVKEAA
jgi:hypothetical protein